MLVRKASNMTARCAAAAPGRTEPHRLTSKTVPCRMSDKHFIAIMLALLRLQPAPSPRVLARAFSAAAQQARCLSPHVQIMFPVVTASAGRGCSWWRSRWLCRCNQSSATRPQGTRDTPLLAFALMRACVCRLLVWKREAAWAAPVSTLAAFPPRPCCTAATCTLHMRPLPFYAARVTRLRQV